MMSYRFRSPRWNLSVPLAPDPLPHLRQITVDCAVNAIRLLFAERAAVQACQRVGLQLPTLGTQLRPPAMPPAAVQPDHGDYRPAFLFQPLVETREIG